MSETQTYIGARLSEMRKSREQFMAALQQLEAKREELAAHINAHNGGIAELERLAASFTGQTMDKMQTKGLLEGLTDKQNKFPDASTKLPKSPSVDSDATRKSVAKSHSLTEGRKA